MVHGQQHTSEGGTVKTWYRYLSIGLVAVVGVAACGSDDDTSGAGDSTDAPVSTDDAPSESAAPEDTAAPPETSAPSDTANGAGGEGPPAGSVLNIAHRNPNQTLDLHQAQLSSAQLVYLDPLYDSLLRREPDGTLVEGLATSWEYTDDAKTVLELGLREGVTFHDGTPFDADAVVANIERGQRLPGAMTAPLDNIESVEAVDAQSVTITLSQPSPSFLTDLASVAGMMASPTAFEAGDDAFAVEPVGSGPWTYLSGESDPGSQRVYDAYEDYWNPADQGVERLVVFEISDDAARRSALLSGQLDIAPVAAPDVDPIVADGFEVVTVPTSPLGWLLLDRDGEIAPELADPRVRQAMNYAIDRQAIVDVVVFGNGEPNDQIFPAWMLGASEAPSATYEYDPDRARELLAEAGLESIDLVVNSLGSLRATDEVVQAFLADVGINVEINVAEPGTLGALNRSGDHPIANGAYGSFHPWETVESVIAADGPLNPFGTTDPAVDELIEQARTASDDDAVAIYEEMGRLLAEEAWHVLSFTLLTPFGVSPDVQNFDPVVGVNSAVVRGVTVG